MKKILCHVLPMLAMLNFALTANAATPASDNAGNAAYADGWQSGDNGGTGFQPWALDYSGAATTNHSDHFIDNGPLAANSLGAPAFGMTDSGRPFFFDTAGATRPFTGALSIGQTVSVDIDGPGFANGDPNGFSKGATVALRNGSGGERFGVFTNNLFNNDNWSVTNPAGSGGAINTGIAAGSSFHMDFTLTGVESYDLVLTPIGGGAPLFQQLGATLRTASVGTFVEQFRFADYGTGSAVDGSSELFINNLSIVPEPSTIGLLIFAGIGLMSLRGSRS